MAYNGYLVKIIDPNGVSDYIFPNNKIKLSTYSAKDNTLYAWSYTDANGYTNAYPLAHKINKITFKTIAMKNTEFDAIMAELAARYTEPVSRTFDCEFYCAEDGTYRTESVHLTDPDISIDRVDDVNRIIYYNEIQFTITVW